MWVARCLALSLCACVGAAVTFPPFDPDDTSSGLPLTKWELGPKNWKMFGASKFDDHSKSVTLVDEDPRHEGRVWSRRNFKHTSWVMEFALKVVGHGSEHDMGKGVGMWITERREKPGKLYGSAEQFKGVGIFFDTFDDDKLNDNPIIMAVENNGTRSFDHSNDGSRDRFGGCRAKYRNRNSLVRAKIKFSSDHTGLGHMQLWLSMKDQGHFDVCFAKEGVRLNCGINGTACRVGFSAQNLEDAKLGDAVSVSGFRMWDLSEIERAAIRRDLAERDRVQQRNQLHPDIQEMLGTYEYKSQNVVDQLLEELMEEVERDRSSKHKEFVSLHELMNLTLAQRGPVTKKEVLGLIASVKQLAELSHTARRLMQELQRDSDGNPLPAANAQLEDLKQLHNKEHAKLSELHSLKSNAERTHSKVAKELREAASSQSQWGWLRYVLYLQGVATVGLVFYKKSSSRAKPIKSHCV